MCFVFYPKSLKSLKINQIIYLTKTHVKFNCTITTHYTPWFGRMLVICKTVTPMFSQSRLDSRRHLPFAVHDDVDHHQTNIEVYIETKLNRLGNIHSVSMYRIGKCNEPYRPTNIAPTIDFELTGWCVWFLFFSN